MGMRQCHPGVATASDGHNLVRWKLGQAEEGRVTGTARRHTAEAITTPLSRRMAEARGPKWSENDERERQ